MTSNDIASLKGPILVLGAAGFVGANLFLRLSKERKDVFAVIRNGPAWRLEGVIPDRILEVDITDLAAARDMIDSIGPQTIFDCVAYGAYSFEENVQLIYRTNFTALVDLVDLLLPRSFAAYVHAGSSSEYGTNCTAPLENAELKPNGYYSVSKAAMSHHIFYTGTLRKFPIINLRLYSVYGPLEDTSRLMPNLVKKAANNTFPPFVDADISRDFIYIDDVCDAFIQAAVRMHPGMYGNSYNIGSGQATTMRQLSVTAKSLFNIRVEPVFGTMNARKWDMADWYSNPKRAYEEFGWKARTSLEQGLKKMSAWVTSVGDDAFDNLSKRYNQKRKKSVSAIIACYKDGLAIPVMHKRLTEAFKSIGCDYEIIFVNDSSPDNSADIIRDLSAQDNRVLGISHSRNFGSQMAFRSGMELSTKDAVVLLDGDLQDPPELIPQLYKKSEEGFEVVYGRRVKRDMSLMWGALYKLFYRLLSKFSYIPIPNDAGDFSIMDRKVVGWILACEERDLFMRGLRAYVGFKQTGVDYVRPERMFGHSTNNLVKNIGWAKKGFFSYSNAPLHAMTAAGFIMLGTAFVLGGVLLVLKIFNPQSAPQGITTILLSILFFGAINLMGIGILGEYIGKIMEEVKARPRLIRSGLIRNGEVRELLPDGSVRR